MKKFLYYALAAAVACAFAVAPAAAQKAEQPKSADTQKADKPAKPKKPPVTGKINVNTATAEQIAMLPGVSLKKARGLIEYRTKNGNFKNIEDIKAIPGVRQKKIDKLKNYVIFEGETTLKVIE